MGNQEKKPPLGGLFAGIGAIVGAGYGSAFGDGAGGLAGLLIGGWLGLMVENILYRLIVVALLIVMIVARQAFFDAMFAKAYPTEAPQTEQVISKVIAQPPLPSGLSSSGVRS